MKKFITVQFTNRRNILPFIVIFYLLIFNTSCQPNSNEVKTYKSSRGLVAKLLDPSIYVNKDMGRFYKIEDIIQPNDPLILELKKVGILKNESVILYTSADCISLVTKGERGSVGSFIDYIVANNINEGYFGCSLNSLYTLNQDEKVKRLNIEVYQIDALLNLFIVKNR